MPTSTVLEVGLDTAVLLSRVATFLVTFGFLMVPALLFWPGVLTIGVTEESNRGQASRLVVRAFRKRAGLVRRPATQVQLTSGAGKGQETIAQEVLADCAQAGTLPLR